MSILVGLIIGVIFGMISRQMTGRWGWMPIFVIGNALYTWFTLPTLQYGFTDIPMLLLFNVIGLSCLFILNAKSHKPTKLKSGLFGGALAISLLTAFVLPFFTSFAGFRAQSYYELAGNIEVGQFSEDVAAIDMTQVRRVDGRLARNVAEKRLGEDRGLGSRVNVGRMSIQAVNGQLYWVGPLNHSKFRRWLDNRAGTPGYVMVSASNENDVKLVTDIAGEKLNLKYNAGSYFGDKPARHVYDNGYATKGRTDWTFEIDDAGRPHYVITEFHKAIGFKGSDAKGVIILDVQTGEINSYGIDDAPKWVDRIQPVHIVREQLTNWGKYKQGWVNSWLGADGVLQTTQGMSLVYGNDGNSYWYTGMQSVGADEGTVGFVLVNTRTKDMRLYEQAGATETAARNSAEDEFQDFGYRSTYPILYNIAGVPTYFMTMKASSGLVKASAFVSVEDYSIVGSGKTTDTALRNYNQALRGRGNSVAIDDTANYETATGIVSRVRQETIDQNVTYYFLVDSHGDKIFAVPGDLDPMVRMTQPGDSVVFSYQESGDAIVDTLRFENQALSLQKSEVQTLIDERENGTRVQE